MLMLQSLFQGDEPSVRAADGYLPLPETAAAETAYAHWTRKMASQNELSVAREMAGLPETRLAELASEFARVPQRQRTDKLRLSFPIAAALLLLGTILLTLEANMRGAGGVAVTVMQVIAIVCLGGGAAAVGVGVLVAFGMKPLDVAHTKLSQCVGLLDEQHPWLYAALFVMRNEAADDYRQRILQERGPLRGIDYLMMREIARVSDAFEMTRVARSVAEQLNTRAVAPATAQVREPRLSSVSAPAAAAEGAGRHGSKEAHATSIRAFEAPVIDRRRPA